MKEKFKKFLNYLWKAFDVFYIEDFTLILIGIASIFSIGFFEIYDLKVISSSDALIVATALIAVNIILSSITFILNLSLMGLIKTGYMDELFKDIVLKKYIVWPFTFFILILLLVAFIFFIYGILKLVKFIIKRK